jgi:hypothetical protein
MAFSTISKPILLPSAPGTVNIFDAATTRSKDIIMSKLPTVIKGPLAWSGVDFEDEGTYILQLHEEDVEEVDAALQSFKSKRPGRISFVETNRWTLLTFDYSSWP